MPPEQDKAQSAAGPAAALDALIPQRPPFRFVDRVLVTPQAPPVDSSVFGLDLPPGDARMQDGQLPAVLLLEALAQASAAHFAWLSSTAEEGLLGGIDHAELLADAQEGDRIHLRLKVEKRYGQIARVRGEAVAFSSDEDLRSAQGRILIRARLSVVGRSVGA